MSVSSPAIPAGWYPDPSGERQWRIWNGTAWADVTRPYGPNVPNPAVSLELVRATRRAVQYGVLALYTGLALLVSVLAQSRHAHPGPSPRFSDAATGAGCGLLVIGVASYALLARALRGRSSWLDFVAPVNTGVLTVLLGRRFQVVAPWRRFALIEPVLTAYFLVLLWQSEWAVITVAAVAAVQVMRLYVLMDDLAEPPHQPTEKKMP